MFYRKAKVRKAGLLLLAMAVAFSFSACGRAHHEEGPDSLLNTPAGSGSTGSLSAEEEGIEFEASLSYASRAYIEMGDESEDKLIRKVRQTLLAADADEKLQIEAVVDALKSVPEDLDGAETFVSDAFTVNFMKFSGSSLVMDLSSDGLDGVGMYDELFFIYQVTDSVLNTFPDLEAVRFTVDGTNMDSLNYVDISSPFTASDVKAFLNDEEDEEGEEASKEETPAAAKKPAETETGKESAKATVEDETDEDSGNEDSSKSSQKSKSTSSTDSNSSEKKSTGSSSSENKSSGSQSTSSRSSGSQSQSSSGSKSGSSSGSTSGSQSSSSGSNSNSSSDSSSGVSNDSSSSSGSTSGSSSTSGGSSSSSSQDGVVNDDDL